MKRRVDRHPTVKVNDNHSGHAVASTDDEMEIKMRILANHVIDRLLEIQEESIKKGLNINKEKAILIMEHKTK